MGQAGAIRNARERLVQTLCFEALGLLLVGPLFAWASGTSALGSLLLLALLSLAVMSWAALFNTVFDWAEHRCTGRVASDRPHRWRLVHAIALEVSATLVTLPLVVVMTGFGWLQALLADVALTLTYAAYGYLFHLAFDRLRPVPAPRAPVAASPLLDPRKARP